MNKEGETQHYLVIEANSVVVVNALITEINILQNPKRDELMVVEVRQKSVDIGEEVQKETIKKRKEEKGEKRVKYIKKVFKLKYLF